MHTCSVCGSSRRYSEHAPWRVFIDQSPTRPGHECIIGRVAVLFVIEAHQVVVSSSRWDFRDQSAGAFEHGRSNPDRDWGRCDFTMVLCSPVLSIRFPAFNLIRKLLSTRFSIGRRSPCGGSAMVPWEMPSGDAGTKFWGF